MVNRTIIECSNGLVEQIQKYYQDYQKENKGEYIVFFAKTSDVTVTVYRSKKENQFKVVFVGENALEHAQKFDQEAKLSEKDRSKKAPTKACWLSLKEQIGSDEVGTGDVYGPICVCAAYVKKENITYLKKLGVDDSKRLNDDDIRRIGEQLIHRVEYSQVSLSNEKFNEVNEKGLNMNEIKAKMHNQVLKNLRKKHPKVEMTVIDEFCREDLYYSYLFGEPEIVDKITFKTKAETYFPCVAAASIIARFSFLQKMDKLNEKYKVNFPYGASSKVDDFTRKFIKQFGVEELKKIAKLNFANVKAIIKEN